MPGRTGLIGACVGEAIVDPDRSSAQHRLAIGAVVGTLAHNAVNGTVIVLFVWILDVFLGPAMGSTDRLATRFLPTHFVTLWMVNQPSGHGGRLGDFGSALAWTILAAAAAWSIAAARTRTKHPYPWRHRAGGRAP